MSISGQVLGRPGPVSDVSIATIAEALGRASILGELPDRHLRGLAKEVLVRDAAAGHTVIKRGDDGIGFYIILSGEVEVRRGNRVLARLGPGQFFGEMALFDDQPRSADVVATKATKFGVLSRWEFTGFAESHRGVYKGITKELARRLRETDQSLSE